MEKLTKKDLVTCVRQCTVTGQRDATFAVDKMIKEIKEALAQGKEVDIAGFGKFVVVNRPEREGINPMTKEKIVIPAKKVVKFKPAKALKECINE